MVTSGKISAIWWPPQVLAQEQRRRHKLHHQLKPVLTSSEQWWVKSQGQCAAHSQILTQTVWTLAWRQPLAAPAGQWGSAHCTHVCTALPASWPGDTTPCTHTYSTAPTLYNIHLGASRRLKMFSAETKTWKYFASATKVGVKPEEYYPRKNNCHLSLDRTFTWNSKWVNTQEKV